MSNLSNSQKLALVRALERRFGKGANGYSFKAVTAGWWRVTDNESGSWILGGFSFRTGRLSVSQEHDGAALTAEPAPPAAPVASDPVPADVPCYLAVSYHDGAETVLGVFRVAEHANAQAAEAEASKLCDRIRAAAPLASYGTRWSNGKGDAPAMVPQVAQQQQARDMRRGMARCDGPGLWQIGIYSVERDPDDASTWHAHATGPGTIGNGYAGSYPTLAAAYRGLTGEPMPGARGEDAEPLRPMVPQPCQPQQGRARSRAIQPPRGERRYVTVRDTETGEIHRVLTSVARVGFAVVVFVPSNRHRQGALGGMLITHDEIRKAWVFNDEAEARHMLSRNHAPGERVIRAELVSDPAI